MGCILFETPSIIKNHFNDYFKLIYLTLIGTTTPGQSGPGSNGNKGVTPHSPAFQN